MQEYEMVRDQEPISDADRPMQFQELKSGTPVNAALVQIRKPSRWITNRL
jgi:hypothetical protein